MIHLLGFCLALVIATAVGLGATLFAVQRGHGFDSIGAGSWRAWPKDGASDADPYARAATARSGRVPLAPGEGLMLEARSDDEGAALRGACTYRVAGTLPPARLWTMTAYDSDGAVRDNPAHRLSFTSSEIIRDASGRTEIVVGPEVRAGNWLPVAPDQAVILVVRLYDTPLGAGAARLGAGGVPSITRIGCP